MPIASQIRMLQVTASLPRIHAQLPANPTQSGDVAEYAANDLSGSLAYFARALQNIHGSKQFGDQMPGLIQHAIDPMTIQGTNTAAQAILLEQHDGTTASGLKLLLDSTGTNTASTILLRNAGGTSAAAIKIETAAAGDINIDSGKDLKVDVAALMDVNVANLDLDASAAVDIDAIGSLSLNGGAASDFTVGAGGLTLLSTGDAASFTVASDAAGEDLTIQQTGGHDSGIAILAAGTGADAIKLDATAGGVTIESHLKMVLDADATGQDAFTINSAGGIDVVCAQGDKIDMGRVSDTQLLLSPNAAAADNKISLINVRGDGVSVGTRATNAVVLAATAGAAHISGQSVIFSGSGVNAITFAGDNAMTSGAGNKGMLFADYAEYASFRGKSIFTAATTVVGALNSLADSVSGATATIFTGSRVGGDLNAGQNFTVGKLAGDNANLVPTVGTEKAQVYLNGQLLLSASAQGGIALNNDYKISANNVLQFQFQLRDGDFVQIIDAS